MAMPPPPPFPPPFPMPHPFLFARPGGSHTNTETRPSQPFPFPFPFPNGQSDGGQLPPHPFHQHGGGPPPPPFPFPFPMLFDPSRPSSQKSSEETSSKANDDVKKHRNEDEEIADALADELVAETEEGARAKECENETTCNNQEKDAEMRRSVEDGNVSRSHPALASESVCNHTADDNGTQAGSVPAYRVASPYALPPMLANVEKYVAMCEALRQIVKGSSQKDSTMRGSATADDGCDTAAATNRAHLDAAVAHLSRVNVPGVGPLGEGLLSLMGITLDAGGEEKEDEERQKTSKKKRRSSESEARASADEGICVMPPAWDASNCCYPFFSPPPPHHCHRDPHQPASTAHCFPQDPSTQSVPAKQKRRKNDKSASRTSNCERADSSLHSAASCHPYYFPSFGHGFGCQYSFPHYPFSPMMMGSGGSEGSPSPAMFPQYGYTNYSLYSSPYTFY